MQELLQEKVYNNLITFVKKIFNIIFLLCCILLFNHNAHADDAVTKILDKAQELTEKQKIKGKNLTEFITNNVITVDYEGEERAYKFNTDITYEVYVGTKIVEQGTWSIKGLTKKSIKLTGHQDLYIQIYKDKGRISTLTNLKKKNDSQTNRKILKISSSSDFEKQLAQIELEKQKALEQKKKEEEEKRLAKLKAEEEKKQQEEEEKRIAEEEKKLAEDEKKEDEPKTLAQKKKELEEKKQLLADKRKALQKKKAEKGIIEHDLEEKIVTEEEKKLAEDEKEEVEQKTWEKFLELKHSKYITFDEFKNHFDGKVIELSFNSQPAFAFFKVDMSKYDPPNLVTDFYWMPHGNMGMSWTVIENQVVGIFFEPTHEGVVKKVYLCDRFEQRRCKPGGMVLLFNVDNFGFGFVTISYSKDAGATLLDGTKTQGGYFLTPVKNVKKGEIQYEEDKITFYSEREDTPAIKITLHDSITIKAIENACKKGKNFDDLPLICSRRSY